LIFKLKPNNLQQDPIVLDILSMLANSVLIFDEARLALSDVKTDFDLQAVTAEAYLTIVASQV
jgi:hypothetical protein